jgi:hypothetical protein
VNTLGNPDKVDFVKEINQVSLYFVYLAVVTLVSSFFEVAMFMWSGALLALVIAVRLTSPEYGHVCFHHAQLCANHTRNFAQACVKPPGSGNATSRQHCFRT